MAQALPDKSEARTQPRVILAVDDDTTIRRLISQVLSKKYLVLSASDGKEAMRMLLHRKIDLVLTDIRMPEMGGLDLAHHVRDRYPDVPVAFVSAWLADVPATQAAAFGPWRLSKPFMIHDLLAVVDSVFAAGEPESAHPEVSPAPARPWQSLLESGGSPAGDSPVSRSHPAASVPPSISAPQAESPRAWQSLLEAARPPRASAGTRRTEPARVAPAAVAGEREPQGSAPAPPGAPDESPRRLASASAVGLEARHRIHSHVNQASLVWECRKKMAGGKPLMLPGENSPFESVLGPDDEVEVSDVDASVLRRGDFAYWQDEDALAFLRVAEIHVLPDGSLSLVMERPGGERVQLVESRLIGRVTAVVRKGLRIPVGTLSIYTKVAGWLETLGSWSGLGRRSA